MRRCPWAAAGPVRSTRGQYPLQTSSNRSSLNPLASAHVTNVVNLRPKTLIFSEKAVGLTTFVTTDQKSTRKTPPIDDVCNNTQRSAPKSQHDKPDHIGGSENQAAVPVGGGGAWPGFEATRRATHQQPGPTGAEGAGGTRGPGCGARGRWRGLAGLRGDAPSEARGADGERAGRRPRRSQAPQPGPPAPGTPVGPHSNTTRACKNAHPEPGGRI